MRSVVRVYPGPLFDEFSIFEFRISLWPGDVAQLGERRLCKPEVAGSSPVVSIEGRSQRPERTTLTYFGFVPGSLKSQYANAGSFFNS